MVGVGDGDQRRQVQHRLAALHGRVHAVRIADVAGEDLEPAGHVGCAAVEPAPGVERVVEDEGAHLLPGADQGLGQVRADEAVGAGDEDAAHAAISADRAG
jgi:hypothetical protein